MTASSNWFDEAARKAGKIYFLIPYFIHRPPHPGVRPNEGDMPSISRRPWLKATNTVLSEPNQVQNLSLPAIAHGRRRTCHCTIPASNPLRGGCDMAVSEAVEGRQGPCAQRRPAQAFLRYPPNRRPEKLAACCARP